jgi:microcystin-dependent protein
VFMPYVGVSAPSGWLLASGMTIGNPTSGATSRANADTLPLYTLLWTSYANLQLPIQDNVGVPAVRGASAAVDFAAGKRLPLPDLRGRVVVGGDSMGGVAANRVTTAGSGIDGATHGTTGGSQSVILTEGNLPAHTHDTLVPTTTPATGTSGATGTSPGASSAVASDSTGNGEAFPIAQPSIVANYIIKL